MLPAGYMGISVHTDRPSLEIATVGLGADLVYFVATLLARIGRTSESTRLISAHAPGLLAGESIDVAVDLIEAALRENQLTTCLDIGTNLLGRSEPTQREVGEFWIAAAISRPGLSESQLRSLIVDLKRRVRLEAEDDRSHSAGVTQFNISMVYLKLYELQDALTSFEQTHSYEPEYAKRPYFNRELGGVHFGLMQFAEAAAAYEVVLADDQADVFVASLTADANLFAGNYVRAGEILTSLEERVLEHPLATADSFIVFAILEALHVERQSRTETDLVVDIASSADIRRSLIEDDALNGRVWLAGLNDGSSTDWGPAALLIAARFWRSPLMWMMTLLTFCTPSEPRVAQNLCHLALMDYPRDLLLENADDGARRIGLDDEDVAREAVRSMIENLDDEQNASRNFRDGGLSMRLRNPDDPNDFWLESF